MEVKTSQKHEENVRIKEAMARFLEKFNATKTSLHMKLSQTKSLPPDNIANYLDEIDEEIQSMNKSLSDSVTFLLAYDTRICQENLKSLHDVLEEQQKTLIPKKRFAFKSRQKETNKTKTSDISSHKCVDFVDGTVSFGFRDQVSKRLTKNSKELEDRDVSLSNLTDCQIYLEGCSNTVHASHLRKCQIYCGPVKTSVFIDDCQQCVFMVACQQLRLHSSYDSDLYLHATSDPIIEDCSRVRVAPYCFRYEGVEKDFEISGLSKHSNRWDSVKDFNWLAADMPSPNWQIIPTHDRIKEFKSE